MIFAPHRLEKLQKGAPSYDENDDTIPGEDEWVFLCMCRCDDAGNKTLTGEGGIAYSPLYKIVCDNIVQLNKGDKLRAVKQDGSIRGQGIVDVPSECNYLNYQYVYLK